MEIAIAIVVGVIAAIIFGAARSRSRRHRSPAEELTDLRSAANLTATIFASSALMLGIREHGGDTGQGADGVSPMDFAGSDLGGGFGGGDMGGSGGGL